MFQYSDFRLTAHDSSRVMAAVDKLYHAGLLTKEPAREHHWVGVAIVRRLTKALLQDALNDGTVSWDVVISKVLSLVLVASLTARSGDVLASRLNDNPRPAVFFEDLVVKLVGGDKVENLVARITIRNEKGFKYV